MESKLVACLRRFDALCRLHLTAADDVLDGRLTMCVGGAAAALKLPALLVNGRYGLTRDLVNFTKMRFRTLKKCFPTHKEKYLVFDISCPSKSLACSSWGKPCQTKAYAYDEVYA